MDTPTKPPLQLYHVCLQGQLNCYWAKRNGYFPNGLSAVEWTPDLGKADLFHLPEADSIVRRINTKAQLPVARKVKY